MLLTLFNTFKENSQSHTRRLYSYQSNIYSVFFQDSFHDFLIGPSLLNMWLDTSTAKAIYIGLHVAIYFRRTDSSIFLSWRFFFLLFLRDLIIFNILCRYMVNNRSFEKCHKHIPANTL